jgi:hypothetical protein
MIGHLNKNGLNAKIDLTNPKRIFIIVENKNTGMKYFGKLIAGRDGNIFFINRKCNILCKI